MTMKKYRNKACRDDVQRVSWMLLAGLGCVCILVVTWLDESVDRRMVQDNIDSKAPMSRSTIFQLPIVPHHACVLHVQNQFPSLFLLVIVISRVRFHTSRVKSNWVGCGTYSNLCSWIPCTAIMASQSLMPQCLINLLSNSNMFISISRIAKCGNSFPEYNL